jgi:putative transposase
LDMRTYRRLHVRLSKGDREKLDDILSAGVQAVRTVLRALVLCRLDEGRSASKVAAAVRLTAKAVREIGRRYEDGGLEQALYEQPRPGAAPVLDASQKQRIIAMVCSAAPEGRARWTVRLVAEEAVKRRLVAQVGRETIRLLLLHHDLKPWREKNVVRGRTQRGVYRQDGGRLGDLRKALRPPRTGGVPG